MRNVKQSRLLLQSVAEFSDPVTAPIDQFVLASVNHLHMVITHSSGQIVYYIFVVQGLDSGSR